MTNEIACCDNLDFLKMIPSESVQFSYNDLPFLGVKKALNIFPNIDHKPRIVPFFKPRFFEIWRTMTPTGVVALHINILMLKPVLRISKHCFGKHSHVCSYIVKYPNSHYPCAKHFSQKQEMILVFSKDIPFFHRDNREFSSDNLRILSGKFVERFPGEKYVLPFQKPLALVNYLVCMFSERGDMVSDFFCGSGTTAVSAAMKGRFYSVCDINPDAISFTQKRLSGLPVEKKA